MKPSRTRRALLGLATLLATIVVPTALGTGAASAATTPSAPPPAALAKLIPSPQSRAAQAPGTYTGDAGEWAVGIVMGGSEALVYLCDGKNAGQWFGAKVKGNRLTGSAPNGSVVAANLKSGVWSGTVSLGGKPVAFRALAATKTNTFGIWRAKPSPFDGADYVLGWISTSKGIRGISQTSTGTVANGIVINTGLTPTVNGIAVKPAPVERSNTKPVPVAGASTTTPPVAAMSSLCTTIANAWNFSQTILNNPNATQSQTDTANRVSDNMINAWYSGEPSCRDANGLMPIY